MFFFHRGIRNKKWGKYCSGMGCLKDSLSKGQKNHRGGVYRTRPPPMSYASGKSPVLLRVNRRPKTVVNWSPKKCPSREKFRWGLSEGFFSDDTGLFGQVGSWATISSYGKKIQLYRILSPFSPFLKFPKDLKLESLAFIM